MDRSPPARRLGASVAFVVMACSGASRVPPAAGHAPPAPRRTGPTFDAHAESYRWESATSSPRPIPVEPGGAEPCGTSDAALRGVAERIAKREAGGLSLLDTDEITFALRSAGAPYVRPRAWTLVGEIDAPTFATKVDAWMSSLTEPGERRCASSSIRLGDGRSVHALVAVAALADLDALPTEVSIGTWLDLSARLLVPATRVEVIVLGPRGRPHAVLSSLDRQRVRARFRADDEGSWLAQIVATTETGPELAAEAMVFAGSPPPEHFDASEAPGERASPLGAAPEDALLAMVNGARGVEGLRGLRRDARLDALALEQARAMRASRMLSHDVSGSSLVDRISGLSLRSAGENVAHAADLFRAHRSLWASPSHRENLLHPAFELIGIGTASDDDGTLWVCEIFGN